MGRIRVRFTARSLVAAVILTSSGAAMAGLALAAAGTEKENISDAPSITINAQGWLAVTDGNADTLKRVGWIDPSRPPVPLKARDEFLPGDTATIGYQVVIDDSGRPIGFLASGGFVRGGVTDDGSLTPSTRASLIQATGVLQSASPEGAPPRR
jgi:hypothetical protein